MDFLLMSWQLLEPIIALVVTLSDVPHKTFADVNARQLDGPAVANLKSDWLIQSDWLSDWLKRTVVAIYFKLQAPALLILKASRQIFLTLATHDSLIMIG